MKTILKSICGVIVLMLAACHTKHDLQYALASTGNSFWDIYDAKHKLIRSGYRFYKGGKCFLYIYDKRDGTMGLYDSDNMLSNTWVLKDSILTINEKSAVVLRFSLDSVFLRFKPSQQNVVLVKSHMRPIHE